MVADYARKEVQERDIAEGFIREMAKRVAGDAALDLGGMKQAVRNAIEIYEKEIAGRPVETSFDDIVNRVLAHAKEQIDRGQSGLARATLRSAAEEMRRDEEERRERYVESVSALFHRVRDIALATYDGEAAAEAAVELARSIHAANAARNALFSEANDLEKYGDQRGSNVHLVAAIRVRRELLSLATSADERGAAWNGLGNALSMLGERETGTTRLEEAIQAFRAALRERRRRSVPLDWAQTQMDLGRALFRLGERESRTTRLRQAVAVYRRALKERTRTRAPLQWAQTQSALGHALLRIGNGRLGRRAWKRQWLRIIWR